MSPSYQGGPACPSDFPSRTRSKLWMAPPRSFSNFVKQSGIVTSCQTFRFGDQNASLIVTDWIGTGLSWLKSWEFAAVVPVKIRHSVPARPPAERTFILNKQM